MTKLRFLPWLFLVALVGCVSPTITLYRETTPAEIAQRVADNNNSRYDMWNTWKYAGSDDRYDYIYQYDPGAIVSYGFYGYKLPRGEINVGRPYDFNPDLDKNRSLW
jgi:hypothetical protein